MKSEIGMARIVPGVADPLGESLHSLRLEGTLYCRVDLTAPWAIKIPDLNKMMSFQVVTSGSCWLVMKGQNPIKLNKGSFCLIPHGLPHTFCDDPTTPPRDLFDIPVELISDRYEHMNFGGGGAVTQGLQGVVRFDNLAAQKLIALLPSVIVIHDFDEEDSDWIHSTLRFISREARTLEPGGETIITRLADILVIQAIRHWLKTAPEAQEGWLGALKDPQLGPALTCIHREPEKPWTVESLAHHVGMSRSAFSMRFTSQVGESVIQYLTSWRLQLARTFLKSGSPTISEVIDRIGYQSEAAFCRAFKKMFGESPGRIKNT